MKFPHIILFSFLSLLMVHTTASAATEVVNFDVEEKRIPGDRTTYTTGTVGLLRIRTELLKKAIISPSKSGLSFLLSNGSNFLIEDMTARRAGFPDANMQEWAKYLFGLKKSENASSPSIKDAISSNKNYVAVKIAPKEIRVFNVKNGSGYWAYGQDHSLIVITRDNLPSQIAIIHINQMSEQEIKDIIIQGVN